MMHGLGRLYIPDARDARHALRLALGARLPRARAREYRLSLVLDQGMLPICVGCAWRLWLAATGDISAPNATTLYHEAQMQDDNVGAEGASVRAGAKALAARSYLERYLWARGAGDVRDWLLGQHGPLVFGTNWYRSMFETDKDGFVRVAEQSPREGGYAYTCIGYSDRRGAFRFVSSWGAHFGQKGRFWMDGETVERLLIEEGEACAPVRLKPGKHIQEIQRSSAR